MPYRYLDEIATADIAFVAEGKDLPETFASAVEAMLKVMIENPASIVPRVKRHLKLENDQLDMLLFDLLQEIIYYKDAERLMLRVGHIRFEEDRYGFRLDGVAEGETLDPSRHEQRLDVKAVTLHRFELKKVPGGWKATVIVDV